MLIFSEWNVMPFLKHLLKSDYILLAGNPEAIETVEQKVYPPGTPLNLQFIGVFTPIGPLYLGKRTGRLGKFLSDPPELSRTVAIFFMGDSLVNVEGKLACAAEQVYASPGKNIDAAIEELFARIEQEVSE